MEMTLDLFHIDYSRLMEVLITIVVLSFLIERALAVLFEHRWFIKITEGLPEKPKANPIKGLREIIATVVCVLFCYWQDFDGISIILQSSEKPTIWGIIITGFIIAGGSKASVALFKDLLGFMSTAEKDRKAADEAKREVMKAKVVAAALQ